MKSSWIAALLLAGLALGFALGGVQHGAPARRDAAPAPTSAAPDAVNSSPAAKAQAAPKQKLPAASLQDLDGMEFVRALPSLQAQAKAGDAEAMRLLYKRLGSCVLFRARTDEEIHAEENRQWEQQLEFTRDFDAHHPDRPRQPPFDEASLIVARDRSVREAFDRRDLCTSVSEQQRESRLDWLQRLIDRHDRATILDATAPMALHVSGIERVRNAERLVQLAQSERDALDVLIASGDIGAIDSAMRAYSQHEGLLDRDAERAYAYAYALSLIGAQLEESQRQRAASTMQMLLKDIPGYPPLSADQAEQARAVGLALYQRCCAAAH